MLNSEEDERNVDPDEVGHRHNFIGQSFFPLSRQTWKQKVFLLRTEMIIDTPRSGNCQYIVTLLCTAMRMPTNKSQASQAKQRRSDANPGATGNHHWQPKYPSSSFFP